VAIAFMMVFAGPVAQFVQRHPTVKMLALSFLLLIGLTLLVEAFDVHIPKSYVTLLWDFCVRRDAQSAAAKKIGGGFVARSIRRESPRHRLDWSDKRRPSADIIKTVTFPSTCC
jgi:uncharacterized membrane protein YoaK (UPF0700 family)